ncbi:RAS1 protein [Balamuthia mandrillaris]
MERKRRGALFGALPNELKLQLFALLDLSSVVSCRLTCKQWAALIEDDALWKCFFLSHFPQANAEALPGATWQEKYKAYYGHRSTFLPSPTSSHDRASACFLLSCSFAASRPGLHVTEGFTFSDYPVALSEEYKASRDQRLKELRDSGTPELKTVLMGAGGVGCTALISRLLNDDFREDYDPTIEDTYVAHVSCKGKPFLLNMLDTAGQEEYSAMRDQWIRLGQGFMVVFSLGSHKSFLDVWDLMEQTLRVKDTDRVPVVLVGNKADLQQDQRITDEAIQHCARSFNCPYFRVSAKTGENVKQAYFALLEVTAGSTTPPAPAAKPNKPKKGFLRKLLFPFS